MFTVMSLFMSLGAFVYQASEQNVTSVQGDIALEL